MLRTCCSVLLTVVALGVLLGQVPGAVAQTTSTPLVFPLRAIHASGYWGTNENVVADWHADPSRPLVPADYLMWLSRLHVDWLGLSVALTYDDAMDSTIERNTGYLPASDSASFSDGALRRMIQEFRSHGIDVYLTLAFEAPQAEAAARPVQRWQLGDPGAPDGGPCCDSGIRPEFWPWRPDHPDHERFVAEFWETYTRHAVHVAKLAEEEGARMYSLGTETDRLFRTRSGGYFTNDFRRELASMVNRVRAVYSGLLTYDMHYSTLLDPGFYGPGADYLWRDLDFDVVGISAYFPLADSLPSTVTSVERLEATYEEIFDDYLVPLAGRNPGRPLVLLEYGAKDMVQAGGRPNLPGFPPFVFADANGNGLDDGRETQANIYQAMFNVMGGHPGVVNGAFLWDNWMTSAELWASYWAGRRAFAVRDKVSERVVRATYARTARNGPPRAVGVIPAQAPTVGAQPGTVNVAPYFRDPENDPLTYVARSSDPGIVEVGVTGAVLEITAVGVGEAAVAVTATDGGGWATQTFGVETVGMVSPFTDDPIRPGATPLRAVHFRELRTRIAALRAREGLPPVRWTDPVLTVGVTPVRRVHLVELRTALEDAYEAAGSSRPTYTDSDVAAGVTPVRAAHVMELRRAVRELEQGPR